MLGGPRGGDGPAGAPQHHQGPGGGGGHRGKRGSRLNEHCFHLHLCDSNIHTSSAAAPSPRPSQRSSAWRSSSRATSGARTSASTREGALLSFLATHKRLVIHNANRTAALRRLLDACRRTGRAGPASLVALLLGDREAAIEQALAAGRPEDAAALSGGAGALMLGDEDRARVNVIVDAWNRALELDPPATTPTRLERL